VRHPATSRSSYHPGFLLFLLALLAAVVGVVHQTSQRQLSRAPTAVTPAALRDTIFVAPVLAPGSSARIDAEGFFRAAAAPSRMFLGIFDGGSRMQCATGLQNSVRITHGAGEWLGEAHARATVAAGLYRDERYVLLLPAHARLAPRWDETLVALHAAAPDAARAVLTSHCNVPTLAGGETAPRFLRAERMQGARRTLGSRATAAPPRPDAPALPSLFWSPVLNFCLGAVLQHVPLVASVSDSMEVTVNSLRLWTHGYSFFVPRVAVAWVEPSQAAAGRHGLARATRGAGSVPGLGRVRSLAEYEAYTGVQFRAGVAIQRGLHGGAVPHGGRHPARAGRGDRAPQHGGVREQVRLPARGPARGPVRARPVRAGAGGRPAAARRLRGGRRLTQNPAALRGGRRTRRRIPRARRAGRSARSGWRAPVAPPRRIGRGWGGAASRPRRPARSRACKAPPWADRRP